jgi:hypothetical protein
MRREKKGWDEVFDGRNIRVPEEKHEEKGRDLHPEEIEEKKQHPEECELAAGVPYSRNHVVKGSLLALLPSTADFVKADRKQWRDKQEASGKRQYQGQRIHAGELKNEGAGGCGENCAVAQAYDRGRPKVSPAGGEPYPRGIECDAPNCGDLC